MKKNFVNTLFGKKSFAMMATVATMFGMSFTSCNDNLDDSFTHNGQQPTIETTDARLCGYTNLIVSADEIDSERVDLSTGNVSISNENPALSYTVEHDGEGYFLQTHVNGDTFSRHFDKVTITNGNGSKQEELRVVIDPETHATRGANGPSLSELQQKACEFIGYGVNYTQSVGQIAKTPIIDLRRFMSYQDNLYRALSCNKINKSDHFYTEGSSMTELTESVEKKLGVNVKFPVKFVNVSGGFNKNSFTQTTSKQKRDYLLANVNVVSFEAMLDPIALCELDEEMTGKDNDGTYSSILNKTVNNALNNPKSLAGKKYPTTREGMIALLDFYGTHVVTETQFGASAQLSYSKNTSVTGTKTEDYLAYELHLGSSKTDEQTTTKKETSKDDSKNETAETIFKSVIKPVSPSFDFTNSIKESRSEVHEKFETEYRCVTNGPLQVGSKDNLSGWSVGSVDQMVPLTYASASTMSKLNCGMATQNESLIPLYEFCTDPDRRAILEELLTPDADGVLPFYKELLEKNCQATAANVQDSRMVIADVQLVYVANMNLTSATVQPLELKDYYGVTRTYYPMVMTDEHPDKSANVRQEVGHALTLNHGSVCGYDFWKENHGRILCYYALDYASNTNGITNVRLMTDSEYAKNGQKNEHRVNDYEFKASDGTIIIAGAGTWYGINEHVSVLEKGKRRLYVTYGNSDTKTEDKITGVAWNIGSYLEPHKGQIIGATGGTECGITNTFSNTDRAEFAYYWHTKGNVQASKPFADGAFTNLKRFNKGEWYELSTWDAIKPGYAIHPVFTKLPIKRDMTPQFKTGETKKSLPIATPLV